MRLRILLAENDFDFVILDQIYTGLYLKDIRSCTSVPVILRAHNIEYEIWDRTAKSSVGLKRFYLTILANRIRRFELSLINRYDALVPITDRDAAHFAKFGNTRPCHVLPTGMELHEERQESKPVASVTVAHLGALDWLPNENGIKWFISQVWPIIRRHRPGIEFHLAGRNAPEKFEAHISAPGVVYHGEVADAKDFISKHDIFIVPLFSGSGMRIKLLDYMAAGKSIVTTTIGAEGIPIVGGHEAFIADQPEEFANHVITLAQSPGLRQTIGQNAREFVKTNFDNQVLIRQFTDFLKTIDHRS